MGCNCNGCPVEDVCDSVITIVEFPSGITMVAGVTTAVLPPSHPPTLKAA